MIKRNDFLMTLAANATPQRIVYMTIKLINNSPADYWASSGSILQGPFYGFLPFNIEGPSKVLCVCAPTFHAAKKDPIFFQSGNSNENTINLSEICLFATVTPGNYTVTAKTSFYLYKDIESYNLGRDKINKDGTIKLIFEDGGSKTLPTGLLKHIDYGYCITVHAAQGKTYANTIAAINNNRLLNNQKMWLVALSRHKSEFTALVEDKSKLLTDITKNKGVEITALEFKEKKITQIANC